MLRPHPALVSTTSRPGEGDDGRRIRRLECRVGQALSSGETLAAVEELFRAVPESQHKSLAMKVCVCHSICW